MSDEPVKFFPDILEAFFEELDFLWMQRESVVFASDWTLAELAELEERAEAQLDGLRLAGDDGVDLARPFLRSDQKGAATAAAFVLMDGRRAGLQPEVIAALAEADTPAKEGIGVALRHSDVSGVATELRRLAVEADETTRSIAADVLAFHRLGPPPPKIVELFIASAPEVRARAYAAAGRLGGPWSPDELRSALDQPHAGLRWAAIHAAARLGMPRLVEMLRQAAMRADARAPEAIEFLGALGDPNDVQLFQGLLRRPATRLAAIAALGASGRVAAVPLLLEALNDPSSAVAAGKAFARITGARGVESAEAAPPPPDLPDSEREFYVGEKPASPTKAAAWWKSESARFGSATRWQSGIAIGNPPTRDALDRVPLGPRRDVVLAEASRDPSAAVLIELEARAALQLR